MPRSFKITLPKAATLTEPKMLMRIGLGVLLLANLISAMFVLHIVGDSPQALEEQLNTALAARQAEQVKLNHTRTLSANIQKGRLEGEGFLTSYFTTRRHTYSSILGEINELGHTAGMKPGSDTIAPLEPIEGSDDLDTMTLSMDFEGGYNELKKFVNLLDKSPPLPDDREHHRNASPERRSARSDR